MFKYVVYGNKKFTAIYVARNRLLNLDECILVSDKKMAEDYCKIINPKLEIIKPWKNKKEYLEFRKKRINEDLKKYINKELLDLRYFILQFDVDDVYIENEDTNFKIHIFDKYKNSHSEMYHIIEKSINIPIAIKIDFFYYENIQIFMDLKSPGE